MDEHRSRHKMTNNRNNGGRESTFPPLPRVLRPGSSTTFHIINERRNRAINYIKNQMAATQQNPRSKTQNKHKIHRQITVHHHQRDGAMHSVQRSDGAAADNQRGHSHIDIDTFKWPKDQMTKWPERVCPLIYGTFICTVTITVDCGHCVLFAPSIPFNTPPRNHSIAQPLAQKMQIWAPPSSRPWPHRDAASPQK